MTRAETGYDMGDLGQPQPSQQYGYCVTCVVSCVCRNAFFVAKFVYLFVNMAVGSRSTHI